MTRKTFYSVHNDLASAQNGFVLELNPAVVMAGEERRFALSAVCLGPALAAGAESISMTLDCDGVRQRLESLHHQSERSGERDRLTVALFDVGRDLLQRIASSAEVEIELASEERQLVRRLGIENLRNVAAFLDRPELTASKVRPDEAPTAESVAV